MQNPQLPSRRGFLQLGVAAAAGVSTLMSARALALADDNGKNGFSLTIAGYPYERVTALVNGRVQVEGCQVDFVESKIGELNQHVFSGPATRDVTEVGLIPFLLAVANDGFRDYQLLPVFVLKVFRHKSIFVHKDRGITTPEDLRGRKVATVGYSSSGLTWIRGIMQDEYGVKPNEIQWVITSKDSAKGQTGGVSKWEKLLPKDLKVTYAPEDKDESDLLLAGDVDAIFHPAEPQAFVDRHPKVKRLFSDVRAVESAYFKRTGIFPIMHVVAIRRELVTSHPELPKAVFQAFCQARDLDYEEIRRIRWAYSSLPWYGQEFDRTRELMGENFYSYGIRNNRKALEAALRYLHQQGLAKRELTIGELFEESTMELDD